MAIIKPEYILAVDQGTTASRAKIFNKNGRRVTETETNIPQIYPHSGWVEENPHDIWHSVQSVIASAMINSGVRPDEIQAIGIANQRETTIVWDKGTGQPIYNAIVWQSNQTSEIIEQLRADGKETFIQEKTGLPLSTVFSASKIRWILDHVDGAQARAEAGELLFGTVDTWLTWKLSGGAAFVTDFTNASRTMLFNINDLAWDDELLELFNVPRIMLPEIRTSSEVYGTTEPYQFFGGQVPIAGLAGDQQASMVGQMGFDEGFIKNTYGAGSFILMNTGDEPVKSEHKLISTIAYAMEGEIKYAIEGSIFVAGSAIQWLHDGLHMISTEPETKTAANNSTNDDEVYFVPAFSGLSAPYWDPDARGAVFGITRGTNRDDFIKATLQSIAYQTRDVIETMRADTGYDIESMNADGSASRNAYLMQFQADILDAEIRRAADEDTTALGAAFLAGLAVGYWESTDEIREMTVAGRDFDPEMDEDRRETLYHGWKQAVKATQAFKPKRKYE
jgi:glycerol kinase